MISNYQDNSKSTWTSSLLKKLQFSVSSRPTVLMGDFMVVMVHDESECDDYQSPSQNEEPATILAVDLRNNSVKEHEMDDFFYHEEYSFTKYKNNQIIKFGGIKNGKVLKDILWITIRSFRPFHIVCEEIEVYDGDDDDDSDEDKNDSDSKSSMWENDYDNIPALYRHTAQIYKNHLYVYGGRKGDFYLELQSNLWKFHLKKLTWKLCKPKGEGPGRRENAKSFILEDSMYIYGGYGDANGENDIFMLDLKANTWIRIQQQTSIGKQISLREIRADGDLYKGNLLVWGSENDEVCCWNLKSNSWSTFEIQEIEHLYVRSNLIVYKNLLVVNGATTKGLSMAILDLDNLEIPTEETPEQKGQKQLFMSEEESDIKLKVEDRLIPAHKQILIEKSKYFANLFNSGMVESRQEIIDIQDCEYTVFQEFLRYLYCKEVKLSVDMAIKLTHLSDKYLQNDLNNKCMNFFKHNLTSKNIYTVLDFALEENISHLVNWCFKFFENNLKIDNVPELIQYLDNKPALEFEAGILKLRKQAFQIIRDNFIDTSQKQPGKLEFYEDFLIRNIEMDTFASLANFISVQRGNKKELEKITSNLRRHVFDFAHQNFDALQEKNIFIDIDKNFFIEVYSYEINKQKEKMNIEDENEADPQLKKDLKRKEPSRHDGTLEENPLLKLTKKD